MENDKIPVNKILVTSALTGMLLGVPKFCLTGLFYWFGVIKWFGLLDAGAVAYRDVNFQKNFIHMAFAAFVYLAFGGLLAVMLGFFLHLTGKRYSVIKGAYFGFFIWIVFRNFFASISLDGGLPSKDAITAIITYVSHMLWGMITAYIIAKTIPFKEDRYLDS